jgi:CheY-like chemotaxis protein
VPFKRLHVEANHGSAAVQILVIEDNTADVELLRLALDSADLTYVLTAVADGADALTFFRQDAERAAASMPDIVVLDLNLPKYDGLEILEAARSNVAFAELPIVVLSSSSSPRELAKIQAFGFVRFITKPPDLDRYLQIGDLIKEFLNESLSHG